MICRWVIDSRLATLGRRIVITTAVFGLTTVGSAGVALGAPDTIGRSPSAKVVSRAPMAVSITFRESLRGGGARIRILTDDGDVGTGRARVTADRKILKRELRLGAPAGPYTVLWNAVSVKGRKMSGQFSFRAARSNGEVERRSPVPSPPVSDPLVSGPPIPGAQASDPPASDLPGSDLPGSDLPGSDLPGSSSSASSSPGVPGVAVPPTPPTSEPSGTAPSGTPEWISGSDPIWTPESTATDVTSGSSNSGSSTSESSAVGSGDSGTGRGVSTGFTAIPLTVGGLLVLAAGMVSLINRHRLHG